MQSRHVHTVVRCLKVLATEQLYDHRWTWKINNRLDSFGEVLGRDLEGEDPSSYIEYGNDYGEMWYYALCNFNESASYVYMRQKLIAMLQIYKGNEKSRRERESHSRS
jgi:hypothetical protein